MGKQYDFKIVFDKVNDQAQDKIVSPELLEVASEIQALQKIIAEITESSEEQGTYTRA
jgi:hypothetical protein